MTVTQRCAHSNAVPVESGGKAVAALCPDCDRQLPAEWLTCSHENTIELPMFGVQPPYEKLCNDCGTGFWPERDEAIEGRVLGPSHLPEVFKNML